MKANILFLLLFTITPGFLPVLSAVQKPAAINIIPADKVVAVDSVSHPQESSNPSYTDSLKKELTIQWPANRTIHLVFHGHSVPAGYFKTPDVRTFESYPMLTLMAVKAHYPHAVVNSIVTAIGGENSEQGAARFEQDVLSLKPDLLFIDYALNDRRIGLERAGKAWRLMIEKALAQGCKIILLTPTPDLKVDILDEQTDLAMHARQIRELASEYQVGLADSYRAFQELAKKGENLENYMSQFNHPNHNGHKVVAGLISKWLINE